MGAWAAAQTLCALRPQRMLKTKQTETHHVPRLRCDEQAWMHTPAMPASAVRRSRASAQGRRAWESGACSHPRASIDGGGTLPARGVVPSASALH